MACYHPLDAWRVPDSKAPSGHRIVFGSPVSAPCRGAEPITIPCGKCIGCRLAKSREWAVRCVHEASLYEKNCFVTLTFDDLHLPSDLSVHRRTMQLFMKRLRKRLSYENIKIRFFGCGEYGELNARPHYHIIIFNYDFSNDRVLLRDTSYGRLYISDTLFELWPFGFHSIGAVTFNSCAYVARYVTKKVYGVGAKEHYGNREPEFIQMSRRPGIGSDWIKQYYHDVYDYDKVVLNGGRICRPPAYYDKFFEEFDSDEFEKIRLHRREMVNPVSYGRLLELEESQKLRAQRLIRPLEDN